MNIRDYLKENRILTDGAMGTYYAQLYPDDPDIAEKANMTHPERIAGIHRNYLAAGAVLLRTNSFACNLHFFEDEGSMLLSAERAYEIASREASSFAKKSGRDVFVAADIGTVFPFGDTSDRIEAPYFCLIDRFCAQGADIFLFETQTDFIYLKDLISYVREKSPDSFIMASFSIDQSGFTKTGVRIDRVIREAAELPELDAYGFNCGTDGLHMYRMLEKIDFPNLRPLIALPNASYPYVLRGKTVYAKNTKYFSRAEKQLSDLGISIIGGCCGTTPEHIQAAAEALEGTVRMQPKVAAPLPDPKGRTYSNFWIKLQERKIPFIVELDPPFDADADKVMQGAQLLKEHQVDLLTLSDSPLGRSRMDASILAGKILHDVGIDVMPHLGCRDRNLIGLRGTVLGDYYTGIRHFLIVTGDPVPQNDRSAVTQVFDYNSIHFMNMLKEMNRDIFSDDRIVYGGALNYHGANADAIARRMKQKIDAGCSYFLTQPVYSREDAERLSYLRRTTGGKIMAGIMPLVSYRNAMFIANEMPGIKVPAEIVNQYQPDLSRSQYEKIAADLSVRIAGELLGTADGFYFMTPFNRVGLICDIIERIRMEVLA